MNLICRIFGHKWGVPIEREYEYTMASGYPTGHRRTTKKARKVKKTKRWHVCLRCGVVKRIK